MGLSKEQKRIADTYERNLARIDGHEQDWLLAILSSGKMHYLENADLMGF